jgi:hypothetical protein
VNTKTMTHTKQVHAGFGEKVVTLTLDCLERQASKQAVSEGV